NKKENGWMISTEAGREVSEATISEVYKEMDILRNEPVENDELMLVKNFMMGSILGDLDGPFQMIARWKNIILNDLDSDFFNRYISNIKSITASELQETADKYLIPEDFYELVVV
ncbi:MAG TPA: insulinase family protein, partial [Niabella sp.]|nr:insulinase family protein [Niabella sp.]